MSDLKKAADDYFKLLERDPKSFEKADRRLKKMGILTVAAIDNF